MKKNIFSAILMAMLVFITSFSFTSCQQEELDTNQFKGDLEILAFGPSPVARGGELHIIGSGMSSVKTVVFPTNIEVTEIQVIKDEEIVVIVPKAAQPGYVTVKNGSKEATSITRITYTEPVGFAEEGAITPNPVKPGQTLTIKGTYLNLVQQVIFEKDVMVEVPNEDRTAISEEIKVVVPAEAKTGKISLAFAATGDTLLNVIPSKEVVEIVVPSVEQITELTDAKPGDVITITGKDFDLVTDLLGTRGESLEFTVNEEATTISFTIPADVCDGIINVVTASGVKVAIATIGVALPKNLVATPNTELRAGDVIAVTGTNLELVTTVSFPGVAEPVALEDGRTATEIKVKMPEMATSGKMLLNTAADVAVEVEIATAKPVFASFAETAVAMGNDVTINGTKLDLVAKITYAGGRTGEILSQSATQIVVSMPASGVESGKLTLTMANGESVETGDLTVNAPEFCYVPDPSVFLTSDEVELKAGAIVVAEVENMDRLEGVTVDGEPTQYIQNGTSLYILIPESAGMNSIVTLNSGSYGTIDYTLSVIPNTQQKRVVWTGMTELTWGDGGRVFIPGSAFDGVPEGAELVFCYTQKDGTWGQAQVNNGWWQNGDLAKFATLEGDSISNPIVPTDIYGWFADGVLNRETSVVLTQELLDHLMSHVGDDGSAIIIQGSDIIFTQVYIRWTVSLETNINADCMRQDDRTIAWTFPSLMTWGDDGRFRIQRDGPNNLGSTVKLGKVIRFYKSGTGQIQVNNANWGTITTVADWDASAGLTVLELPVDQAILDCFNGTTGDDWSNTALILQGDGMTIQKITIE